MAKSSSARGRIGLASQSDIRVDNDLTSRLTRVAALRELGVLLGRENITTAEAAALVGAQPGAKIIVRRTAEGQVAILTEGELKAGGKIQQVRRIGRDENGDLYIANDYFKLAGGPPGLGGKIFNEQVANLQRAGVKYMVTSAAGSGEELRSAVRSYRAANKDIIAQRGWDARTVERKAVEASDLYIGYNAWANMGYTGFIAPSVANAAAARFTGLKREFRTDPNTEVRTLDVQSVLRQPGGKEWWKENGSGFQGFFDLNPRSANMRILREYNKAKGR